MHPDSCIESLNGPCKVSSKLVDVISELAAIESLWLSKILWLCQFWHLKTWSGCSGSCVGSCLWSVCDVPNVEASSSAVWIGLDSN